MHSDHDGTEPAHQGADAVGDEELEPRRSAPTGETALRTRVRELIASGRLPTRRPDRVWGGPGVDAACVVCGARVARDEVEFEVDIELPPDRKGAEPNTVHVHFECFWAWERECQTLDLASEQGGPILRATLDDSRMAGYGHAPPRKRGRT
jgi:hypothetical protein